MRLLKSVTEEYSNGRVKMRVETSYAHHGDGSVDIDTLYTLSIGNSIFIAADKPDLRCLQDILKELL